MPRKRTAEVYEKLCQVIPGGVNSPVRGFKEVGGLPLVIERGERDLLYDLDGHSYIDYCGSWGALIHGHAHPSIVEAACRQIAKGTTFGITTEIEQNLAHKVTQLVPSLEKVRFVSSGTEATMSALRLARGYTGRDLIIKFTGNYHGHADFLLVQAGSGVTTLPSASSSGIPQEIVRHTLCLPYNDSESCRQIFAQQGKKIAAVILEPIAGNMGVVPATQDFIQTLRGETEKAGSLLIFDEVITGFRVALGGAQSLYKVKPDLTCLGKIVGGGFPAAAFGGRKEIMDYLAPLGTVYQAGTLSGNPVAMQAGLKALELLETPGFYSELARKTAILVDPIQKALKERNSNACLQQVGSMFTLFFGKRSVKNREEAKELDLPSFSKFFHQMLESGIYIPPSQHEAWFISAAHSDEHLQKTKKLILECISHIK